MNSLEYLYRTQKDQLPGDMIALIESEKYKISELQCWTYSGYKLNGRRTYGRICYCYFNDSYICLIFCDDKGKYQTLGVTLSKKTYLPGMLGTRCDINGFQHTLDFTTLLPKLKAKDQKKLVTLLSNSCIDKVWFRGLASSYGVAILV